MEKQIKEAIKNVPDFPSKGVLFRDITPLLENGEDLYVMSRWMADVVSDKIGVLPDKVIGIEARGFVLATAVALDVSAGLVLVRKAGKLPRAVLREECELEYGKAALEMHADSVMRGDKVVIVDDVLATGGTAEAAAKLVERAGGVVEAIVFLAEITGLGGRKKLEKYRVESVVKYE